MWQRIQTVYFILVIILMIAGILLPNAEFFSAAQNKTYLLDSRGIIEMNSQGAAEKSIATNPCTFIFGMILFLTTFCIFNFKDRKKQMRFATINLFSIIVYIIALAVFIVYAKNKLDAQVSLLYPVIFPVISLILNYLAMRGIAKDEKLVRSMDRLR